MTKSEPTPKLEDMSEAERINVGYVNSKEFEECTCRSSTPKGFRSQRLWARGFDGLSRKTNHVLLKTNLQNLKVLFHL